ncbi:helix-turn-helix domain-containing protein [Megamonas funiformis]|uniref:helix-turn-helix domain-containing protein n=1 Tax=Megamonas funiformis TaxID=437897 RepID=UPI003AF58A64
MEMYKFLRQLRIERKLSQSELAEKLELKRSTISMYENGKRQPNIETLILISKIFDIDINILKKIILTLLINLQKLI